MVHVTADRIVVAADGGNSKTDLLLATTAGEVLARVAGAGTTPHVDGVERTASRLAALTRSAVAAAGLPSGTAIEIGSYYLANVDLPEDEEVMRSALTDQRVVDRIEVLNDTFAVLEAGSRRGWGIAVASGAGINAAGLHPDGRRERFLGIGTLSGDWGGGWSVAAAGIAAAVRAGDGRGPATALREAVAATFGADPERVAMAADRGIVTTAQLLAFAPVVMRTAANGDPAATAIAHRLADEVASFAGALLQRMQLTDSDVEIVLGGGMLQAAHHLVLDRIERQVRTLAPRAQLCVLRVPPVSGALASALRLAGADEAAIARGRAFGAVGMNA
jgi:N-acetylglucosamine kinase-like BadF-type ATPase